MLDANVLQWPWRPVREWILQPAHADLQVALYSCSCKHRRFVRDGSSILVSTARKHAMSHARQPYVCLES